MHLLLHLPCDIAIFTIPRFFPYSCFACMYVFFFISRIARCSITSDAALATGDQSRADRFASSSSSSFFSFFSFYFTRLLLLLLLSPLLSLPGLVSRPRQASQNRSPLTSTNCHRVYQRWGRPFNSGALPGTSRNRPSCATGSRNASPGRALPPCCSVSWSSSSSSCFSSSSRQLLHIPTHLQRIRCLHPPQLQRLLLLLPLLINCPHPHEVDPRLQQQLHRISSGTRPHRLPQTPHYRRL